MLRVQLEKPGAVAASALGLQTKVLAPTVLCHQAGPPNEGRRARPMALCGQEGLKRRLRGEGCLHVPGFG